MTMRGFIFSSFLIIVVLNLCEVKAKEESLHEEYSNEEIHESEETKDLSKKNKEKESSNNEKDENKNGNAMPPNHVENNEELVTELSTNTTISARVRNFFSEDAQKKLLNGSFKNLVAEKLFLDRSLLIKELFKTTKKVILLTRPPKWGKTVCLDMIKSFFNVEVDQMGNKKERKEMTVPDLFHGDFRDGHTIYKKLRISGSKMCKKICEHPVIYLDLDGIDGHNETEISWAMYDKIDEVFQKQFPFLNETSFLYHLPFENELKARFERYALRGTLEYGEFKKSLVFLSSLLYKIYGTEPIILVDNYDKSLLNLYLKYGPEHEASVTLRKGLSDLLKKTLRHNPRMRKAFVTGVFPCAKYDLLRTIDVLDCNIFNSYFGQYFGFNENDAFTILSDFGQIKRDKIIDHYMGYSHGNRSGLASPYSIMSSFLNKGALQSYWADKTDIKIFHQALKNFLPYDYKELMSGRVLKNIYLSQKLNLAEIIQPENLLEMLIYYGYLNAIPNDCKTVRLSNRNNDENGQNSTYTIITYHNVSIPNKEILKSFHRVIRKEKIKKAKREQAKKENHDEKST